MPPQNKEQMSALWLWFGHPGSHRCLVALNPEHPEAGQQRNCREDRMAQVTLDVPVWRRAASMPAHDGQFEIFSASNYCRE